MSDLLECIVDTDSFEPYKENYGKTLITGYARIDGWAVGIVANERKVTKNAKGEMQIGGVIYSDSADKATRFIANCNQKSIPLVFLQDVTGFMVGSKSEHQGIIKDGAKLVNAVSNSVVPKFTIIIGNSYGAGNYAMCGKAYDPRLIYAWPSAEIAVMSGQSASRVLLQIEESKYTHSGKSLDTKEKEQLLQSIETKYTETTSPYYAAARLWTDGIIDPAETRKHLSMGIEMANNNANKEVFSLGILQV
jgi:acetyl-CoA carboxylase carboxyltransferase component